MVIAVFSLALGSTASAASSRPPSARPGRVRRSSPRRSTRSTRSPSRSRRPRARSTTCAAPLRYRRHALRVLAARALERCLAHEDRRSRSTASARGRRLGGREPALRAARAARLPGSKNACEQGECGSCSVLLDGSLVCACLVLAAQADGHEVVTVEGLAEGDELHPVQEAFVEAGAVQCGFCTPGLVVAAADLLRAEPGPDRRRDPRGALRQPLPLHRATRRSSTRCGSRAERHDARPRPRHAASSAGSARASRASTASRRRRASSRTRAT